jgi:exodeoxyribonuclease VII large subunit
VQRLARARDRLADLQRQARQCAQSGLAARRRHLDAAAKLLETLSYQGVLARGFALVRDAQGNSIRALAQVAPGLRLDIEVADGRFGAEAIDGGTRPKPAARPQEPRSPAPRPKPGSSGQGSLF